MHSTSSYYSCLGRTSRRCSQPWSSYRWWEWSYQGSASNLKQRAYEVANCSFDRDADLSQYSISMMDRTGWLNLWQVQVNIINHQFYRY